MKTLVAILGAGVLATAVLTACAGSPVDSGMSESSVTPSARPLAIPPTTALDAAPAEPQTAQSAQAGSTQAATEAYIERAVLVLAARLDIATDSIAVTGIEPVDWPDTSLGCPLPGADYLSKVTPGYLVTLAAGGVSYEVHMGVDGTAVVCSADGTPMPGSIPIQPGERIQDGQPWMPVD